MVSDAYKLSVGLPLGTCTLNMKTAICLAVSIGFRLKNVIPTCHCVTSTLFCTFAG